jgi:hypothetical protein
LGHRRYSPRNQSRQSKSGAANVETTFTNADLTNLFQIAMPGNVRACLRPRQRNDQSGGQSARRRSELFARRVVRYCKFYTELSFRVEDVQLNAATPLVVRFTPSEITFEERDLPDQAQTSFSTARWQRPAAASKT